jgi:basic amino acid/polyamine antiporter, APA family
VAAELKDKRNIPMALVLGTAIIAAIYMLVNGAYLAGLGFEQARQSQAIAADLLQWPLGSLGSGLISLLVMVSALGAVNGLIFTGSRLYAVLGAEHRALSGLSRWHPRFGAPITALAAQAGVTVGLILLVGSDAGRQSLSWSSSLLGLTPPSWEGRGGFDTLLMCSAPVFWLFFLLTGVSLFVLRFKDRNIERPFRVPLYPWVPILFCATSVYMLYRSVDYAGSLALVGVLFLLAGLPLYLSGVGGKPAPGAQIFEIPRRNNSGKTAGGSP